MMHRKQNQNAFTLIELLIVVAVIGILVAIAVPNYLQAQRRAESAQCAGNLHTLGQALALYRIDFNSYPPGDGTAGSAPTPNYTVLGKAPAANGSWAGISLLLLELEYLRDESALYCPTLRRRYRNRAQHFRYAYNHAAMDTGGSAGGANDLEKENGNLWLVRCLWLPYRMTFTPDSGIIYPHGDDTQDDVVYRDVMENVLMTDLAVHPRNGHRDFNESFGLPYP